ncbi:MAG: response regulator [candidate division Zixibacteria bacterium]|nr:response regulator [candidate division Zixibacteria bacterium]
MTSTFAAQQVSRPLATVGRNIASPATPGPGRTSDQHRLSVLLEAIELRQSADDLPAVLQKLVELVTKGLGISSVTLYLAGKEDGLLHALATSAQHHRDHILGFPVEFGDGLTGSVAASGRARIINHAENSTDAVQIPGTPVEPESVMAVPLMCAQGTTGVLLASSEGYEEFLATDLDWLKVYGCLASGIVHESALQAITEAERQNLKDQLLHAEKMRVLGEMASGVFHDINNILGAVIGRAEMMQYKTSDEEFKKALVQMEKIIAYNVVRNSDGPRVVRGVHPQLVDAVANLILNALDAMPQGGTLKIETSGDASTCVLTVSDTGVGMSAEQLSKVFSPFFTTKGPRGTGLGLTVVRDVIKRLEGKIELESQPGEGTTFRIEFPSVPADGTPAEALAEPEKPIGLRLLLVDDDHTILDVVAEALQDAGHRVDVFDNGGDAVDAITKNTYDVVVTDLGMPEVTGWDVARAAKLHEPRLPVLVISGWGAQYGDDCLGDTGVDAMLAKPFHLQQLRESVERLAKASTTAPQTR